jgi:hypothetical protein
MDRKLKPRRKGTQSGLVSRLLQSWMFPAATFLATLATFYLLIRLKAASELYSVLGVMLFASIASFLPMMMKDVRKEITKQKLVDDANMDARQRLIIEAYRQTGVLGRARAKLPAEIATHVDTLHGHAKAILKIIDNKLSETTPILRYFTYYLPETANLVTARLKLSPQLAQDQIDEIDQTLQRLIEAFAAFEAAARAPDMKSVDLDIKLLDQALQSELDQMGAL